MLFTLRTHVIHVTPLFRQRLRAGHSSEASEELVGNGIHGAQGRSVGQLRPTYGNIEAQEVLHGGELGSFDSTVRP